MCERALHREVGEHDVVPELTEFQIRAQRLVALDQPEVAEERRMLARLVRDRN